MINYEKILEEISIHDSPLFIDWKKDFETFFHITVMGEPTKQDNVRFDKNLEWLLPIIINKQEKLLPLSNTQAKQFILFMCRHNIQEGNSFSFRAFKKPNSKGVISKNSQYYFQFKLLDEDNLETKIQEGENHERHNREGFEETRTVDSEATFKDQQTELDGYSNNRKKILKAVEEPEETQQPQEKRKEFTSKSKAEVQKIAKEKGLEWLIKVFKAKWESAEYQIKLRLAWAAWCFTTKVSTYKNLEENLKELQDELENGFQGKI